MKFGKNENSDVYSNNIVGNSLPKNTLPYTYSTGDDKTDLRDVLDSELKRQMPPGGIWSNEPWDHIATFKKEVLGSYRVIKSRFKPFREVNYKSCHWLHSRGMIYQSTDSSEAYKKQLSCGEKLCLLCDTNKRKRQGLKAVTEIKAIFKGMPGAPGILFIDFTLPRHLESLPLYDITLEKNLKNGIHKIIKKLFDCKTRSNIGLRLSVHAVGSKDIMRDRWHCHVDIIPGEVIKSNSAELKFHWLRPTHHRAGKNKWILDLPWLKEQWRQVLLNTGLDPENALANPQVEFCEYPKDKKDRKPYWRKVTHKITYNLRSMATDLEKTFLRSDFSGSRMIIKGATGNVGYWYNLKTSDVVDRFSFIRSKSLFRKRGFLSCTTKYKDVLILEWPPEKPSPGCFPPVPAEIITLYEKQRDHKGGKWVTVKQEIWHWQCPITGADRHEAGHKLKQWKIGVVKHESRDPENN